MTYNEWPSSNVRSPVYIVMIENAWGWYGKTDQTGYQVWNKGQVVGSYTTYDAAAVVASEIFCEIGRATLALEADGA